MLPIKEDDDFFSRIVTKESSISNPSFRVYYGGNSVAVPFRWEAKPGTPKHIKHSFSNEDDHENKSSSPSYLPPLTPPPSYYLNNKQPNKLQQQQQPSSLSSSKKFSTKIFLGLFPNNKRMHRRQISSTSSSSSSTLSCPSSSMLISDSTMRSSEVSRSMSLNLSLSLSRANKRRTLSSTGSLFDFIVNTHDDEDDEMEQEGMRSPRSILCFGCVGSRRIRSCSVA